MSSRLTLERFHFGSTLTMVLSDFGPSLTRVLKNIYRMWYRSAKTVPVSQIIWRDNEYVPGASTKSELSSWHSA